MAQGEKKIKEAEPAAAAGLGARATLQLANSAIAPCCHAAASELQNWQGRGQIKREPAARNKRTAALSACNVGTDAHESRPWIQIQAGESLVVTGCRGPFWRNGCEMREVGRVKFLDGAPIWRRLGTPIAPDHQASFTVPAICNTAAINPAVQNPPPFDFLSFCCWF